jgi:tetratricopeptide (TPR) repeat protein
MEEAERSALIRSVEAVLQDIGTFIHNAWANDQLNGYELRATLGFYNHMRECVAGWNMPHLEAELAIAQSVILDEGLDDRTRSLEVISDAIEMFGQRPSLIRQKSKVLKHQGLHDAAASALIEIEDGITGLAPLDQGLAFRDGGEAAANAKRFDDALRLFSKANAVFAVKEGFRALSIGLIVDEAMVLWELGRRAEAIRRAGDALEEAEEIDPLVSRQNLRAHRMARAVVGLFMHEIEPYPHGERPPVTPGMGSALEGSEPPEAVDLPALADNWRILEAIESEAGVEACIATRSAARQGRSRAVAIEAGLAKAHFSNALEAGDINGSVRAILPAVTLAKRFNEALGARLDGQPALVRADISDLRPLSISELTSSEWLEATQAAIVYIMMRLALAGDWSPVSVRQLQNAVSSIWDEDELLVPLIDAANSVVPPDGSSSMPIWVASSLRTISNEATLSLTERIRRDLYWIHQVANSLGRQALEPLVVSALAEGWRFVLERQRFLLSMPIRSAPAIEVAIELLRQRGIRAGPQLLEAAANGAKLELPTEWRPFLAALGGDRPVGRQ